MMDDDHIPPVSEKETPPSPGAQISGLIGEVRALANAELDYAKARLSYSGGILRKAGIFAILAVVALSSAVVALILGILLIVASYFGPWIATIAVVITFGLAALIFAMIARNTARNLSFDGDISNDG
jgi:hypothetical protein